MNPRTSTVAGASALLAAGLVGVTAPAAEAAPARITSAQQLQASIAHAVALEKQSKVVIACCPAGKASNAVHTHTAFCSAEVAARAERD